METNNKKPMCYINYLDKDNKFKPTKKDFQSYEAAYKWMQKTFDTPNRDFINYY